MRHVRQRSCNCLVIAFAFYVVTCDRTVPEIERFAADFSILFALLSAFQKLPAFVGEFPGKICRPWKLETELEVPVDYLGHPTYTMLWEHPLLTPTLWEG